MSWAGDYSSLTLHGFGKLIIGVISDRKIQKNIFKRFIYAVAYGDDEDLRDLQIS